MFAILKVLKCKLKLCCRGTLIMIRILLKCYLITWSVKKASVYCQNLIALRKEYVLFLNYLYI